MRRFAPLLVIPLAIACGRDCKRDEVATAKARLQELSVRLNDAERLAGVTGRIALTGPVKTLQDLHREIEAVQVPPCMRRARYLLASQAELDVTSYVSFMAGDEGEELAAVALATAKEHSDRFSLALDTVTMCAPSCPQLVAWTEEEEKRQLREAAEAREAAKRADEQRQAEERAKQEHGAYVRRVATAQRAEAERAERLRAAEAEATAQQARELAAMKDWHRGAYLPAIKPLKAATAEADAAFRRPDREGIDAACSKIDAAVSKAKRGPAINCPDTRIAGSVAELLRGYEAIAAACKARDWQLLQIAGRQMARSTDALIVHLRPYGLKP